MPERERVIYDASRRGRARHTRPGERNTEPACLARPFTLTVPQFRAKLISHVQLDSMISIDAPRTMLNEQPSRNEPMIANGSPRILVLGGSLNQPSHTSALARTIANALVRHGADASVFDLAEHTLPTFDPRYYRRIGSHPDPEARRLGELASWADAFVLATPTYHNSYSGLLKNALDHLDSGHFEGKPVGLASNGGRQALTHAVDHLRQVARGVGAVAIPAQVATASPDYGREGERYALTSPELQERVNRLAGDLVWYVERLGRRGTATESCELPVLKAAR
jgi:NAD(P)H-dependent FMN reductase